MIPIIIPINHREEVNCIIQDGIRYCEKTPLTKDELGITLLFVAVIILWFMFWMWAGEKIENKYDIFPLVTIMLGGLVLPAIILGILLLI